jgi:hypothetical protein
MKTYMLWHGGSSYGVGSYDEDVEEFDTLRGAVEAFANYADHDPYRPCVSNDEPDDGGPSAWLFFYDPRIVAKTEDPYPDRELCFGPRGAVRMQPC